MQKSTHHSSSQRGAGLLLIVLLITLAIALAMSTYLIILTRATTASYNLIRSETSYGSAFAGVKESIIHYLADKNWVNSGINDQYTFSQSDLGRKITKHPDGTISFEITAMTGSSPRTIKGVLEPPTAATSLADILVVIDTSTSMDDPGASQPPRNPSDPNSKMAKAKEASIQFINAFSANSNSTTRLGAINYSSSATLIHDLTDSSNFTQIQTGIAALYAEGSTNIGKGFEKANQTFDANPPSEPTTSKYVILLTDGKPTVTSSGTRCISVPPADQPACETAAKQYAQNQATALKNDGITIFTIGLGNPAIGEIDETLMEGLASTRTDFNGVDQPLYYHAPSADQLNQIYQNIAQTIIGEGKLTIEEVIL